MIKKYTMGMAIMMVAIFLVACGKEEAKDPEVDQGEDPTVEISKDELVPEKDIVAIVNGEDVTGQSYNLVYAQLKMHAGQLGQEVEMDEVKSATMESLIDRELLMQEASEEGIEVTDDDANSEFDTIKTEDEDGLTTLLEQYKMSEDGFKEQLKFELTLNQFKEKAIDVSVSDDEVEEYYNQAKEENEDMPELDEIKDQLKGNIEQQKSDEELQKKIDEIREKAKIENKMDA